MKLKINYFITFLICIFLLSGCSSLKQVTYSFVQEDNEQSSSINFVRGNPGITFISFEENNPPEADEGTIWNPIIFASGISFNVTVHAYYYDHGNTAGTFAAAIANAATASLREQRGIDTNVIFTCPPLETGKEYRLSFSKGNGVPGANTLILTKIETKEIVCRQEFDK